MRLPFMISAPIAALMIALGSARLGPAGPDDVVRPVEKIRLVLNKASMLPISSPIIECEVTLINDTGAALDVKSNFFSAYDALELVIFGEGGEKRLQQLYSYHQSPYTFKPRSFPLAKGENRATLRLPIDGALPAGARSVKVLIMGRLAGVEGAGVLCSNLIEMKVP